MLFLFFLFYSGAERSVEAPCSKLSPRVIWTRPAEGKEGKEEDVWSLWV